MDLQIAPWTTAIVELWLQAAMAWQLDTTGCLDRLRAPLEACLPSVKHRQCGLSKCPPEVLTSESYSSSEYEHPGRINAFSALRTMINQRAAFEIGRAHPSMLLDNCCRTAIDSRRRQLCCTMERYARTLSCHAHGASVIISRRASSRCNPLS